MSETTNSLGYWEPHTSSVDFCEPNYIGSIYFAEFHNTWRSLYLVALGIYGLYHSPSVELRYKLPFFILIIVGFGSAALHGTLHWWWQSSDEVPMLWANLSFIFALHKIYSCHGESTTQFAIVIISIGLIQTYIYYSFRHLFWLFIAQYAILLIVITFWFSYLVLTANKYDYPIRLQLLRGSLTSYLFIGLTLWGYEMQNCDELVDTFIIYYGLSYHILWHIGAGLGTYLLILLLITIRMQTFGAIMELKWNYFGFFPIIIQTGKKLSNTWY